LINFEDKRALTPAKNKVEKQAKEKKENKKIVSKIHTKTQEESSEEMIVEKESDGKSFKKQSVLGKNEQKSTKSNTISIASIEKGK
jgi:hypothetical protein